MTLVQVFAFIAGELDEAVVGADPDQAFGERGFGDGEDGVVVFGAGIVEGNFAAGGLLLALVVASEVGADGRPVHAAVGGFEEALAAVVERVGIVRREHERGGPLEAMFHAECAVSVRKFGLLGDRLDLADVAIVAGDVALIVGGVDDVGIGGIGSDVAGFAAADVIPIGAVDGAVVAAAGDGHGAGVLLRAVDAVGHGGVGDHVIELRGGLIVLARPVLAAIESYGDATVVGGDHAARVAGIDPQAVIVAVRNFNFVEEMAAVGGFESLHVHHVNGVFIARIGDDVHVIPGALPQAVAGIDEVPGFAAVIGAIEAAIGIVGLDQGVDAIGIGGDGDADAAVGTFGQTVLFKALPGGAAVGRAVEAAARAAVGHAPGSAARLPESGE